MLTLCLFIGTLCVIAHIGDTLEKDSKSDSLPEEVEGESHESWLAETCRPLSQGEMNALLEQELSICFMLAKESLLDSASDSAPYEN